MIRQIQKEDYNKGFLNLINIFTRDPIEKSYEDFCEILNLINSQGSEIYVIEEDGIIVSTAKVIFEPKLHNNFAKMGHIEDVVTIPAYRGHGYASLLIKKILERCKEEKCYKVILTSNIINIPFYKKNGFIEKGTELTIYL